LTKKIAAVGATFVLMLAHRYRTEYDPRGSAHMEVISPTGWKVSMGTFYSYYTGFNRFSA
jgi:hypothetical protein